jgi:hypothetical protein
VEDISHGMRSRPAVALALALLLVGASLARAAGADKPRVLVLTDIENEPDDAMSMVWFLTYANHFDIEGLVAPAVLGGGGPVSSPR